MKKLFALFLISIMLLSSCADIDKSGSGSGDTVPTFDVIALTNNLPPMSMGYNATDNPPPTTIDHIVNISGDLSREQLEELLACKTDITLGGSSNGETVVSVRTFKADLAGIIDNKENCIAFYEGITEELYSDRFSDDFFENYVVLTMFFFNQGYDDPFVNVYYSFDSETKKLRISFTERPHEGWGDNGYDAVLHTSGYFIPISKSDITIDGKLVPYEELNIEVTGTYIANQN